MQNPLKLASIHQPNENIIELLESLLSDAKKGEIQSIAIAALRCDGSWTEAIGGLDRCRINALIGSIESLKFTVLFVDSEIE